MMRNLRAMVVVAMASLSLGGCASAATAQGMTVTPGEVASSKSKELANRVTVDEVVGGSDTKWFDSSKIDNENLKGALVESLRVAGLLNERPDARYKMNAVLVSLDQPMAGVDMTVTTKIRYTLTDKKSGAKVFEEEITASYTAHLGDAFMGVTRLRLAVEGSARKSIASFIEKLAKGKVDSKEVAIATK